MKEFEGIELSKQEDHQPYSAIIFFCDEELSQRLFFDTEKECNKVMSDLIAGKGVLVTYEFQKTPVRVFPHKIIKAVFVESYNLYDKVTDDLRDKLKGAKPEVNFPEIALNKYQPTLAE